MKRGKNAFFGPKIPHFFLLSFYFSFIIHHFFFLISYYLLLLSFFLFLQLHFYALCSLAALTIEQVDYIVRKISFFSQNFLALVNLLYTFIWKYVSHCYCFYYFLFFTKTIPLSIDFIIMQKCFPCIVLFFSVFFDAWTLNAVIRNRSVRCHWLGTTVDLLLINNEHYKCSKPILFGGNLALFFSVRCPFQSRH